MPDDDWNALVAEARKRLHIQLAGDIRKVIDRKVWEPDLMPTQQEKNKIAVDNPPRDLRSPSYWCYKCAKRRKGTVHHTRALADHYDRGTTEEKIEWKDWWKGSGCKCWNHGDNDPKVSNQSWQCQGCQRIHPHFGAAINCCV